MNDLYVWCMMFWGHLPDSRYTGTLLNCLRQACVHCECLRLATGPRSSPSGRERRGRGEFWGVEEMGLADGLVPMLLWTEHSGRSIPLVFPWWRCKDEAGRKLLPACLSCVVTRLGWGRGGPPCFSEASEALGLTRASDKERERGADMSPSGLCNLGTKTPPLHPSPLLVTVWKELFLVFLVQLLNVQCVM